MGDVGSLALGGALGIIAVLLRQEFLLVIMGGRVRGRNAFRHPCRSAPLNCADNVFSAWHRSSPL